MEPHYRGYPTPLPEHYSCSMQYLDGDVELILKYKDIEVNRTHTVGVPAFVAVPEIIYSMYVEYLRELKINELLND